MRGSSSIVKTFIILILHMGFFFGQRYWSGLIFHLQGVAFCQNSPLPLGPKGMGKMIQDGKGDVTIPKDDATILKQMQVLHPVARMLMVETLLNSVTTSLNSKVVSQYSNLLSPMSIDAVMKVIDPTTATSIDL
uniref:Uncharacterized protein n=1 Tax=Vombatus ursinus TaxID=29139 RepID=A0A4X2KTZ9_VOMUR